MSYEQFKHECTNEIDAQGRDPALRSLSNKWIARAQALRYSYHFEWLGRPIIQYPQDIVAMQELIWSVQPDLIIETGIAHGGSLIFSASMLELNAICGGHQEAEVLGIDIDIRSHNREAIEMHPMFERISMIQGSSIAPDVIEQVRDKVKKKTNVLVCLDSNHTHTHVLAELEAYAPFTSKGSYCVVFDTIVEDLPDNIHIDRPWKRGNNSKTAVWEYLEILAAEGRAAYDDEPLRFQPDQRIDKKLLISVAPTGYLKRIS